MKYTLLAVLGPAIASAHYNWPNLVTADGNVSAEWQYVRESTNHYSNGPIQDVTDSQMFCYDLAGRTASATATVSAGDTLTLNADTSIIHPGPGFFYMAKVPDGDTADSWDGAGVAAWFKIYESPPTIDSTGLTWDWTDKTSVSVTIPSELPSGTYLLRVEHIALHSASTVGGAQFYLNCAELQVTGGGSGTPSPLVAFPGAYSATDPGILIDIYYPVPTNYTMPGPAVWPAASASKEKRQPVEFQA